MTHLSVTNMSLVFYLKSFLIVFTPDTVAGVYFVMWEGYKKAKELLLFFCFYYNTETKRRPSKGPVGIFGLSSKTVIFLRLNLRDPIDLEQELDQ